MLRVKKQRLDATAQFSRDLCKMIDARQLDAHKKTLMNPEANRLREREEKLLSEIQSKVPLDIFCRWEELSGAVQAFEADELYMRGLRDGVMLARLLSAEDSFAALSGWDYADEEVEESA